MKFQKWWHRPKPTGFLNFGHQNPGTTEYDDTYIRHQVLPTESFKPVEVLRKSEAKVSDRTTFRCDYIPHSLTKYPPHQKEEYVPPNAALDGVSVYRQDYPVHKSGPIKLARRKESWHLPRMKFEARPTYASDFKRWRLPPRVKVGSEQTYVEPDIKMEGTSTFQQDFVHRFALPRESSRPPNVAFQSDAPLDGSTIHNTSYVPHPLEARAHQREKKRYIPPTIPMDRTTTFQLDFTGQPAMPAESMKPAQTTLASKDPLSKSSEFRDRFVAWPVSRPQRRESTKYLGPQGAMDLQTTQRLDFRALNARPATPKKPVVTRPKTLPFDGITNYSNDFKKWNINRTLARRRKESFQGGGTFDGLSTTRQHYVSYQGVHPAQSFKPDGKAFQSDALLDDTTIYRMSYVPQSMRDVERYPTPDWMKFKEEVWKRQGILTRGGVKRLTPKATPINAAA